MMYLGDQAVGLATSLPEFADIAKIECGNYTPSEDTLVTDASISHSLGEIPDFIMYFSKNIPASNTYQRIYLVCGYCIALATPITGIRHGIFTNINKSQVNTNVGVQLPDEFATDSSLIFPHSTAADYLKSNETYHYVIGKFKEVTSNANE